MARVPTGLVQVAVRRSRPLLLCSTSLQASVLVAFAAAAQPAPNARPTGGSVVAGSASIGQSASTTTINQSSQRAAIDWRSFDVGRDQTVQFNQPGASAITLNRVIGPDPSSIAGRISANGQLIITNQSGVVFHQGAQVDAASLVVSAPGITNQNFMNGRMVFDQAPKPDAQVSNAGRITVKEAGLAALVAPRVANSGVISARMGQVVLAGATAHTIDLYGDGLLSIDVTQQVRQAPRGPDGKPVTALVTNTGTLVADGGVVQLTAQAADGIVQTLVDAGGRIQANAAGGRTGRVVIAGIGGDVRVSGRVAADGGATASGGTVELNTTGALTVAGTARVTASGGAGGGVVAVGTTLARATGGPAVRNQPTAARTTVEAGATVAANARVSGNGGQVTVLSQSGTVMAGRLAATGGRQGGGGGAVEISGGTLTLSGTVDTGAPKGTAGHVLIDPDDFTITDAQPDGPNSVTPATLEAMNASLITVTATGNLIAASSVTLGNTTRGVPESLQLTADNAITINAGVTLTAAGSISLNSGTGGISLLGSLVALGNGTYSAFNDANTLQYKGIVLSTTGAITQGANSTLGAYNLSGSATSAALTSRNNTIRAVGKDGLFFQTTAQDFALVDRVDLVVGGAGTISGGGAGSIAVPNGRTISLSTDNLTLSGATFGSPDISAPGGTFAVQPYTAGTVPVELSSNNVKTPGSLSLTDTELGRVTAATLVLGSPTAKSVTIGTDTGQVDLGSHGITTLNAQAAGPVAEFQSDGDFASLGVTTFTGSGASLSMPGANFITQLGGFISPGAVYFHTGTPLHVTGAVSGTDVTLSAAGDTSGFDTPPAKELRLSANVTASGTLHIDTTTGTEDPNLPVIQDGGVVRAGTLSGITGDLTLGGQNVIAKLGDLDAGAVALTDAGPLQLTGTITAGSFALTVSGDVTQPSGSLSVDTLSGSAASLSLTQRANTVANVGDFATSVGGFTLVTQLVENEVLTPVDVVGAVSVPGGQTIAFTADAFQIGGNGSLSAVNGTVALQTLTAGRGIELVAAPSGRDVLSVRASDVAAMTTGTLQLGAATSNGDVAIGVAGETLDLTGHVTTALLLRNTGAVTENGALIVPGFGAGTVAAPVASITMGGANQVGSLVGLQATGAIAFTNAQQLGVAGDIAGSSIALTTTAGGLALTSGTVSTTGGLALSVFGAVTQDAGVLDVNALTGRAGSVALNGTNLIGSVGPFTSDTSFALTDGETLTVADTLTENTLALNVTGDLIINATINSGTSNLVASGAITEGIAGVVIADTLTGSATSADFGGDNQVEVLTGFTTRTGFALNNAIDLTVAGPVTDRTSVTLQANNSLTISGRVDAPDITATATRFRGAGDLTIASGGLFATGALSLNADGFIQQTGGSITGASLTGGSGTTTSLVSDTNQVAVLKGFTSFGGFALQDAETLTVTGPVLDSARIGLTVTGDLVLSGALTAPAIALSATGDITQPGGTLNATGTLSGNGRTVTLDQAGNKVADLGTFSATGDFSLSDGQTLAVVGPVSAGDGRTLSLTADTIQLQGEATLTAQGGTVALAPLTAGQAFTLSSFVPPGTVSGITASTLRVGSASSGALTIDGVFTLPNVTTLDLRSGATIAESGTGAVIVNTLSAAAAGDVTLSGANRIARLAGLTTPGRLTLNDTGDLVVAGPVTVGNVALTASGDVQFAGDLTTGLLQVNAGGTIQQTAGVLTAATLTGSAAHLASFGDTGGQGRAVVTTLGAFSLTGSTFVLLDSRSLTVLGPLTSGNITITAPGSLTLQGGQINTDNATLTATAGTSLVGGQLVQTGTTTVSPIAATPGALRLAAGQVTLANLLAPNENLSLSLANGTASGALNAAALAVDGSGGGTNLAGTVARQTGFAAAYVSTITPAFSQAYQINGCAIASVSCGVVVTVPPPTQVPPPEPPIVTPPVIETTVTVVEVTPVATPEAAPTLIVSELVPKSFYDTLLGSILKTNLFTTDLITLGIVRDPTDPNLVLPNVSDRDY